VNCGTQGITIAAGGMQQLGCFARYASSSALGLTNVGPRAGLADVTAKLTSSATEVFTVTPGSLTLASTSVPVTLKAVSVGSGILQIQGPAAFGPSPDGSERLPVTVTPPSFSVDCLSEWVMEKDTQRTCTLRPSVAISGLITAKSSDPSLLIVSTDPNIAGSALVSATGQSMALTLQALSSYGTVEVAISAPGYQDTRFAIVLRPLTIIFSSNYGPVSLKVGNTYSLNVSPTGYGTIRAGANIAVDLSTDQAGVVSLSPSHIVLTSSQSNPSFTIKGIAAGSTVLRMSVPPGYTVSGTPIVISVSP
jgi:hypothetical protein